MKQIIHKKRLTVVLILAVLALLTGCSLSGSVPQTQVFDQAPAADTSALSIQAAQEAQSDGNAQEVPPEETEPVPDPEPLTTVFFASDYQQEDGYPVPAETLKALLDTLTEQDIVINHAVFGGDYSNVHGKSNYNYGPNANIWEIRQIVADHTEHVDPDDIVFVQGNHDMMTDMVTRPGLHDYGDYLVYVLNAQTEYPWRQGYAHEEETVRSSAERLSACLQGLIEAGDDRPVFIASHVPLHYTGWTSSFKDRGDNLYASYVFDAVNEAAQTLDIVFLVGHNHAVGWDSYLGGGCLYLGIGDTMIVADHSGGGTVTDTYTANELNFTYLNYGYIGYVEGYSDTSLSCTIAQIYPDKITMTRYGTEGMLPMGAAGAACQDPDDSELIPECYYTQGVSGAIEIPRHRNHTADPDSAAEG